MFDLHTLMRTIAALVAVLSTAGGFVQAALPGIDRPATVSEWADRGVPFPVGEADTPATTPYGLPVADAGTAAWGSTHSSYPAADIFVRCGAELVSPVWGTVLEVRRVNSYDPAVDNPATRGGKSVSILGYDGVRYYLAHLAEVADGLEPGNGIELGQSVGVMGDTGRSSACHLHFSISPPCPGKEWSVRRGVVWPQPYLDAWRRGESVSPIDEITAWSEEHPRACEDAMADPYAPDS